MKNKLKELRKKNKFTQEEASNFLGVSLRSYIDYEKDNSKVGTIKYNYMISKLEDNCLIDEEHGVLTNEEIKNAVSKVFKEYDIEYCYLFGSYAKNKANEKSDIDLLVSTNVKGIKFYGLVEKLRNQLHKKIDLLHVNQLKDNIELLNEILKEGIKIYG